MKTQRSYLGGGTPIQVAAPERPAYIPAGAEDKPLLSVTYARELQEAIQELTLLERTIVELYHNDRSFVQIAKSTGMAANWVGELYRRAADKIATTMRERLHLQDVPFQVIRKYHGSHTQWKQGRLPGSSGIPGT